MNNNKKIEFTYVNGDAEGFIFEIDAAVSMADAEIIKLKDDFTIQLDKNTEYKYCFVSVEENGFNWCSKDGNEWFLCVSAFVDGEPIDLFELSEMLKGEMSQ